jgi:hypothetical protein
MTSSDLSSNWTTYIFAAANNTLSNVNLSLLAFSQLIHSNITSLTNYYITGVYFGFRIYTGRGSFTYSTVPQLVFIDNSGNNSSAPLVDPSQSNS